VDAFNAGTLAGAGSFHCAECGYAITLKERDEMPACPECGSKSFRRASMFERSTVEQRQVDSETPLWLADARGALVTDGDYLAYEDEARVHVRPLQDGWTRVGRSLAAHLRFDDPTVSRRHALVYRGEDGARILDDRSLNGVFVAGERIDLHELCDGDQITIGRFNLYFMRLEGVVAHEHDGAPSALA
jgi:pSer/pThr/pTyr-binding forkhead associated (FHA) protein